MKNIPKKLIAMICGACLLSVTLTSCLKETNNQNYNPPVALVSFIQASPDEPSLDFTLDNNKVNVNPLNFGDNIGYFQAFAGTRTANFTNHATSAKIFSDTATFAPNNAYSLFLANVPSKPEIVVLKDTINRPADGKTSIRFVNLSPDASSVDLAIQGGAVLISNKSYKGYSTFIPETGNTNYNFEVRQHGTNVVLATLSNISLNSSYIYTIWLSGLATPLNSSDKLSLNYITNAYY
jgi:Domain of unknown function (DUF4397)